MLPGRIRSDHTDMLQVQTVDNLDMAYLYLIFRSTSSTIKSRGHNVHESDNMHALRDAFSAFSPAVSNIKLWKSKVCFRVWRNAHFLYHCNQIRRALRGELMMVPHITSDAPKGREGSLRNEHGPRTSLYQMEEPQSQSAFPFLVVE